MMRLVAGVCVLVLLVSCMHVAPTRTSVPSIDVISVFLTGSELGALKPCGCSGGQLGGLDRRGAVFDKVPQYARLIVDTGSLVENDHEQDLIKFGIIHEAFELLGYDLVNLSEHDINIATTLGLLDSLGSAFSVISARQPADVSIPSRFTRHLSLKKNQTIAVTVASSNTQPSDVERVKQLFSKLPDVPTLNILILDAYDPVFIDDIAKSVPTLDCVVCPGGSDEPMVISQVDERPLVFSVGHFGRYVGVIQIFSSQDISLVLNQPQLGRIDLARLSLISANQLEFVLYAVPITEDLPQKSALVQLYKNYQQLLKENNLLEKYPRVPLPNGLEYIGSEACKECHDYEYEMWSTKPHTDAFATLEKVGSHVDPECVICHVIGMEYETGFVSDKVNVHLKNVGCENCHGPGSEHARTSGEAKTTQPQSLCLDCHTPEKSAEYADNEQQYFENIIHWREPNTVGDVQQ